LNCDSSAGGDVAEVGSLGLREVERQDHRLGVAGRDDLVVELLEGRDRPAVQHDGGAARGACARERRADAAGRAGDQHDAFGEVGRRGVVGIGKRHGGSEQGGRDHSARAAPSFARLRGCRYNFRFAVGV
jgi:hypothetical protein